MMGDKQDQSVGAESTAIQVGGDLTVVQNQGLSLSDVEQICLLIFEKNFPTLLEKAVEAAKNNVQEFAKALKAEIGKKSKKINLAQFADPDVQAAICDAVQATARKGEKANPAVLVDLITERVSFSKNDYKNIVISEAVTVVPKLTKAQIAYLSFILYMTSVSIKNLPDLSGLEPVSREVLSLVSAGFNLSDSQRRHIEYAGACSIASIGLGIYDIWTNHAYKYMGYTNMEKFKNDIAAFSPSSQTLLDIFDQGSGNGHVKLTSVGEAIAIANLSRTSVKLDYSIWLQ